MQKLVITIALAVMTLALGTTTTTMQLQPAYSQASHCGTFGVLLNCVQVGKDPSFTHCGNSNDPSTCSTRDIPRGTVGQEISDLRKICGPQGPPGITCSVTPP